jgi:hypothetical protein
VAAAVALARAHGVPVSEPRVVRDLSNVLVALPPAELIARVATTTAAARRDGAREWLAREVSMARFLAGCGAAVVAPARAPPPGPHEHDGLVVTFWRLVEVDPERPSPSETGLALRRLHGHLEATGPRCRR